MKITKLKFENIGMFEEKEIDFDLTKPNIISGPPRTGKTTVLLAIQAVFSAPNTSICKNIISKGKNSGKVQMDVTVNGKTYSIIKVFGEGSLITVDGIKCNTVKSMMELLDLSPSVMSGIFSDSFFNKTSAEKRNSFLSANNILFPDMKGMKDSDNPVKDKTSYIKNLKSKLSDYEKDLAEKNKNIEETLNSFKDKSIDKSAVENYLKEKEEEKIKLEKELELKREDNKKKSSSYNSAVNKVPELEKEVSKLSKEVKSVEEGKCPYCKAKMSQEKVPDLNKEIEEKKGLVKKGKTAIEKRETAMKESDEELRLLNEKYHKVITNISKSKETLNRVDDGNVMTILKNDASKKEKEIEDLKKELKIEEEILKNYCEKSLPEIEIEINESYKTKYFDKVSISIFNKETFELKFEMEYDGKSYDMLCGEEQIFAKLDAAKNFGTETILINCFEGSDSLSVVKEMVAEGIQVIAAETTKVDKEKEELIKEIAELKKKTTKKKVVPELNDEFEKYMEEGLK